MVLHNPQGNERTGDIRSSWVDVATAAGPILLRLGRETIKVLCEQTRKVNKLIEIFFGLCLILFGLGNIVADFHV